MRKGKISYTGRQTRTNLSREVLNGLIEGSDNRDEMFVLTLCD